MDIKTLFLAENRSNVRGVRDCAYIRAGIIISMRTHVYIVRLRQHVEINKSYSPNRAATCHRNKTCYLAEQEGLYNCTALALQFLCVILLHELSDVDGENLDRAEWKFFLLLEHQLRTVTMNFD